MVNDGRILALTGLLALMGAVKAHGSRGIVRSSRPATARPRLPDPRLRGMLEGYQECAPWASEDKIRNSGHPFSAKALARFKKDCQDFLDTCDAAGLDLSGIDSSQLGHDFWLTRNRHGAGFWDRGLGELGKQLTDLAHAAGECSLYIHRKKLEVE